MNNNNDGSFLFGLRIYNISLYRAVVMLDRYPFPMAGRLIQFLFGPILSKARGQAEKQRNHDSDGSFHARKCTRFSASGQLFAYKERMLRPGMKRRIGDAKQLFNPSPLQKIRLPPPL